MKKNGIINSYNNIIEKGSGDFTNVDASIMEKVIIVNLIVGILSIMSQHKFISNIGDLVLGVSMIYFIFLPIMQYHRNFKSEYGLYIYITPVKKIYVLFSAFKVWLKGFGIFIVLRIVIGLTKIILGYTETDIPLKDLIHGIDPILLTFQLLQMILFTLGIYMIIVSLDIITVVKRVPSIIAVPVAIVLLYFINNLPDALSYRGWQSLEVVQLIVNPMNMINYGVRSYTTIVMSQPIALFVVGLIGFIYSISIFEQYTFDYRSQGLISMGKYKGGKWSIVVVIIIITWVLGGFLAFNNIKTKQEGINNALYNTNNIQGKIGGK